MSMVIYNRSSYMMRSDFDSCYYLMRDGMDWIDLAQDRDQRRALVNTVMNLRVP
jgi:hypothetical protein